MSRALGPDSGCPFLLVELRHLGGRLKAAGSENAVGGWDAEFHSLAVNVPVGSPGSKPDALAGYRRAIGPFASGYLANLQGNSFDGVGKEQCWTPEQYARLQRTREAFDPHRVLVG